MLKQGERTHWSPSRGKEGGALKYKENLATTHFLWNKLKFLENPTQYY